MNNLQENFSPINFIENLQSRLADLKREEKNLLSKFQDKEFETEKIFSNEDFKVNILNIRHSNHSLLS